MKLYNVPNNTQIRLIEDIKVPPGAMALRKGDVIHFIKLDGMYSYCKDSEGNTVHLICGAEVEMVSSVN